MSQPRLILVKRADDRPLLGRFVAGGALAGNQPETFRHLKTQSAHSAGVGGTFLVAWSAPGISGPDDIFAGRFSATATPLLMPFQVNTNTAGDQFSPSVASSPAGGFLFAWASISGAVGSVAGQWLDANGAKIGTEFQIDSRSFSGLNLADVKVAATVGPSGESAVVWTDMEAEPDILVSRFGPDHKQIGGTFQATPTVPESQLQPSAAIDSKGNLIVTWMDGQVFTRKFNAAGVPQGTQFAVTAATATDARQPDLAVDSTGNIFISYVIGAASTSAYLEGFTSRLPGDFNGDGAVNFADLVIVSQHYGQTGATLADGDFDGDGMVNFSDLVAIAQNYGTTLLPPAPAPIPAATASLNSAALKPSTTQSPFSKSRIHAPKTIPKPQRKTSERIIRAR